jgi:hypothetical protein
MAPQFAITSFVRPRPRATSTATCADSIPRRHDQRRLFAMALSVPDPGSRRDRLP